MAVRYLVPFLGMLALVVLGVLGGMRDDRRRQARRDQAEWEDWLASMRRLGEAMEPVGQVFVVITGETEVLLGALNNMALSLQDVGVGQSAQDHIEAMDRMLYGIGAMMWGHHEPAHDVPFHEGGPVPIPGTWMPPLHAVHIHRYPVEEWSRDEEEDRMVPPEGNWADAMDSTGYRTTLDHIDKAIEEATDDA
jgi:hypothetical protein